MKTLPIAKDYSLSLAPQFDAVEDVKDYFGSGWNGISRVLWAHSGSPREFAQTCEHLGIVDIAHVAACYNLIKGGRAFERVVEKLHNGLRDAYYGIHEDDLYVEWDRLSQPAPEYQLESRTTWVGGQCVLRALRDSDKARLSTYLEWNGILGYTETIWAIALGEV